MEYLLIGYFMIGALLVGYAEGIAGSMKWSWLWRVVDAVTIMLFWPAALAIRWQDKRRWDKVYKNQGGEDDVGNDINPGI